LSPRLVLFAVWLIRAVVSRIRCCFIDEWPAK
jgi:hypothetical protein